MQQPKGKPANVRFSNNSGTAPDNAVTKHVCESDPLGQKEKKSDRFDDMLSQAIDKTLRYVLGDINTGVIYNYLEKRGCSPSDIPSKLGEFSTELRNMLGSGRGQILGAASILEETIVENLSAELEIDLDSPGPAQFADNIEKLRVAYDNRKNNTQSIRCDNSHATIKKSRTCEKQGESGVIRASDTQVLERKREVMES